MRVGTGTAAIVDPLSSDGVLLPLHVKEASLTFSACIQYLETQPRSKLMLAQAHRNIRSLQALGCQAARRGFFCSAAGAGPVTGNRPGGPSTSGTRRFRRSPTRSSSATRTSKRRWPWHNHLLQVAREDVSLKGKHKTLATPMKPSAHKQLGWNMGCFGFAHAGPLHLPHQHERVLIKGLLSGI